MPGLDANSPRGLQENIGCRLAMLHVVSSYDSLETFEQAKAGQSFRADRSRPPCGYCHRQLAAVLAYHLSYGLDSGDLRYVLLVKCLLKRCGLAHGNLVAVLFVQEPNNPHGRNSCHLVKHGFGKVRAVFLHCRYPCLVMKRHGIRNGSVAVENQPADAARDFNHLCTCRILSEDAVHTNEGAITSARASDAPACNSDQFEHSMRYRATE